MSGARSLTAAALALTLGACAVGPNFKTPAPRAADGYGVLPDPAASTRGAPRLTSGADTPRDWWRVFGDARLDALVEEALRDSPTLEAAMAALRAAHETTAAQRGAFYPQVGASYNPVRERFAPNLASPLSNNSFVYSLTTSQLTVSYTPDIFGANRRAVENLAAQEAAQRFELEAARITLANNVAAAAITDASLRAQITATERIVADQRKLLDSLQRQRTLGQASRNDVAAQAALLAQNEALLPPLEKQLAVTRDLIADLVGRTPGEPVTTTFALDRLHTPASLPVSLPSALVRQRPDVRQAEAQLHAASAQVGVTVAARLPNIDLAAAAGSAALSFGGISLASNATFWSVGGTITQPIFQGGTLLHKQKAAEAALDQAKAQYRSTVIGAFQNTADTLHDLDRDAAQAAASARALSEAKTSLSIQTRQLALGDISLATLLAAEQAEAQDEITAIQARAAELTDVAALFQALGGGWWREEPTLTMAGGAP